MSRRRKKYEQPPQPAQEKVPLPNSPIEKKQWSHLMTRRNIVKAGVVGLAGLATGLYFAFNREKSDTTVFDEVNGDPLRDIDCFKQIHGSPELGILAHQNPEVVDHYIHHQRGIYSKLIAQQQQDPSTLYLLEGCNKFMQRQLLDRDDVVQPVEEITRRLARDPADTIRTAKNFVRSLPAAQAGVFLKDFEASLQFLVRNKNSTEHIFGTEPDQDRFEMFADVLRREFAVLVQLQHDGRLTNQILDETAIKLNESKREEMPARHTYMRDLLGTELRPGKKALVALGAAHFRSGIRSSELTDEPVEDYFLQLPDTSTCYRRGKSFAIDSGNTTCPDCAIVHAPKSALADRAIQKESIIKDTYRAVRCSTR